MILAIGTNAGTVYLCNRKNALLQRLRAQNTNDGIASIKIYSSAIDTMVAMGTTSGTVLIYQLPSAIPGPGHRKQLEKFVISEIHHQPVVTMEWSVNGMRLFSGDLEGLVVHTQLDFTEHVCRSGELLRETHEIVQLSYSHKILLVSTKRRNVLFDIESSQATQIGRQERKNVGDFGAVFRPGPCKPSELMAYVARPGLRVWKARSDDGSVMETLLLRDALQTPHAAIPLLGVMPSRTAAAAAGREQFTRLLFYDERYLVTNSGSTLFVVDPARNVLVGTCSDLKNIVALCTCKDEIFVLLPNREVVRLAEKADTQLADATSFGKGSAMLLKGDAQGKRSFSPLRSASPFASVRGSFLSSFIGESDCEKSAATAATDSSETSSASISIAVCSRASVAEYLDVLPPVVVLESGQITPLETSLTSSDLQESGNSEAEAASATAETETNTDDKIAEKLYAIGRQRFDNDIIYQSGGANKTKKKKRSPESSKATLSVGKAIDDGSRNASAEDVAAAGSQCATEDDETRGDEEQTHVPNAEGSSSATSSHDDTHAGDRRPPRDDDDAAETRETRVAVGDDASDRATPTQDDAKQPSASHDAAGSDSADAAAPVVERSLSDCGMFSGSGGDAHTALPSVDEDNDSVFTHSRHGSLASQTGPVVAATGTGGRSRASSSASIQSADVLDKVKLADSWTQVTTPGPIYCVAQCDRYVCYVDLKENVYFSELSVGHSVKWRMLKNRPAQQIAVSPSGCIVWCLYNSTVYAALKVSRASPAADKWTEAVRDVAFIAVDNTAAWYVKVNGTVWMQKHLSHGRPCFKSEQISCDWKLAQISCQHGVVWAITTDGRLIYRVGVTSGTPAGTFWQTDNTSDSLQVPVLNVAAAEQSVWMADTQGQVWFRAGVTADYPEGDEQWWQVVIGGYLVADSGQEMSLDRLRSFAHSFYPDRITGYWQQAALTNLIVSVSGSGVCIAERNKKTMHICRGGILGHIWDRVVPPEMAPSTKWLSVHASGVSGSIDSSNLMWAQHPSGELFCFPPDGGMFCSVPVPSICTFSCVSAGQNALWALTGEGQVYMRTGISAHTPQGRDWAQLDLSQLEQENVKLCHLSCGGDSVWACDTAGKVYMRVGIQPDINRGFPAVWVPADIYSYTKMCQVIASPTDSMIWGIDVKKNVFVRKDVSPRNPIGTSWVPVPGTQAEQLCLSCASVWALTPDCTVVRRVGLSSLNYTGDYWKKLPSSFNQISVTATGELWSVGTDDLLYKHSGYYLSTGTSQVSDTGKEEEWEVL
ncbi:PREDICTED: tectonin beta-propeller repeat-containing protein 2-like [Priapulus caudatus]|uniref:Tectonin beta-propeller repeat-containing protein 2-like n=1 Tax=Priapulus caudatus TaxID=37621 RepID=A0ABM1EIF8_PRICU|nr:PREDICTED: tectonin beta-propeller repeat-containing protein 2-like [Priapulus caudatus]